NSSSSGLSPPAFQTCGSKNRVSDFPRSPPRSREDALLACSQVLYIPASALNGFRSCSNPAERANGSSAAVELLFSAGFMASLFEQRRIADATCLRATIAREHTYARTWLDRRRAFSLTARL